MRTWTPSLILTSVLNLAGALALVLLVTVVAPPPGALRAQESAVPADMAPEPPPSPEAPVEAAEVSASDDLPAAAEDVASAGVLPALPADGNYDPLALDPDSIASMVQTPYGLSVVVGAVVYALLEVLKGLIPAMAAWSANRKRSLSVLAGSVLGLIFGLFAGVPYEWWVALLAGAGGAGGFSLARAAGKGMRGPRGGPGAGAVVGLLLLGLLTVPGCRTVTPALQAGGLLLQESYGRYVRTDPVLTDPQKAERYEVVCNHNRLLGNPVPADCPPAPEVE